MIYYSHNNYKAKRCSLPPLDNNTWQFPRIMYPALVLQDGEDGTMENIALNLLECILKCLPLLISKQTSNIIPFPSILLRKIHCYKYFNFVTGFLFKKSINKHLTAWHFKDKNTLNGFTSKVKVKMALVFHTNKVLYLL